VWLPELIPTEWVSYLPVLVESGRAVQLNVRCEGLGVRGEAQELTGWVAGENRTQIESMFAQSNETALDAVVLGWMESIGPTTTAELAGRLYLPASQVDHSLLRLEGSGQILRGTFRQTSNVKREPDELPPYSALSTQSSVLSGACAPEWCHRRLLARIHRLTIGTLRKEVEPVTAAEFMCFLLQWQHVMPGSRLHGEAGVLAVIQQLAGFEAAASAWESQLLRLRLSKYEPEWLDRLCLSGAVSWGRLSPHPRIAEQDHGGRARRIVPTSVAPISLFPREEREGLLGAWLESQPAVGSELYGRLSSVAQTVHRVLQRQGASFFADLVKATTCLPSEAEAGLWELVAAGLVTADGFDNLRALIDPHRRRAEGRERSRRPRHAAGRWSLLRQAESCQLSVVSVSEQIARQMLRRYGVVYRDLLARESLAPSWRDLLVQYRRMEMAGEVRGGRFVSGFVGEQFALPEAIESLRAMRKSVGGLAQEVKVSACDPLNLAGILLPGPRVPAVMSNFLVFKNGGIARVVVGREGESNTIDLATARG
jgi:ATP-dependent Lhr-like helicase